MQQPCGNLGGGQKIYTQITSSRPTTTQPTTNSCDSLLDWYFITSGGKTRRCGWVGNKLSRCNRDWDLSAVAMRRIRSMLTKRVLNNVPATILEI